MEKESKYRKYSQQQLQEAVRLVRNEGNTIYKAAKEADVPWSSLKRYLENEEDSVRKMGRPYALSCDLELRLYNYIIEMQELGFGLTVYQIRKYAYDLAEVAGRENFLPSTNRIASKWWWNSFKSRYNLCLRVPENLSAYRASMANELMMKDFFTKLDDILTKLNIKDKPNLIWNCDETGLSYVVKPSKVVTVIGKKYVYKRSYAERGQTQTMLACICADGTWIPPMIIFKGVRWNDTLKNDALPNALIKLSPKGWINSGLFLEWLNFFISAIPPERPVVLLMDSHSAHIGAEVLKVAKDNQVHLFTFPAHCTHLLQPLDVGLFKPLKNYWRDSMCRYMSNNPSNPPNRSNFHSIMNPAFISAFTKKNIENAFKKTGICPLNGDVISVEALRPSALTDAAPASSASTDAASESSTSNPELTVDHILKTPKVLKRPERSRKKDSSAKCLTPTNENTIQENLQPQPSTLGKSAQNTKKKENRR